MTDAATPATPESAQAKLSELSASADWTSKFMSGDAAARAEFDTLTRTISGTSESIAAASSAENNERNYASYVKGVRENFEASDDVLQQGANLPPISAAEKNMGAEWMNRLPNDPELSAKLMRGDSEAKRLLHDAAILVNSPVKDGETTSSFAMSDILGIGKNQSRDLRKDL